MPSIITRGGMSAKAFGLLGATTGKYGGKIITYSIGPGGSSAYGVSNGNAGSVTTLTFQGTTLTANGGAGGIWNVASGTALGGTATGGDTNVTGGSGPGASGDSGGGSGGAIGGVDGTWSGAPSGYTGAQSADVSGLQTAITALGYSWTAPGAGGNSGSSDPGRQGKPATGFGCGGGSSGYYGGTAGDGLFGGGGGGCGGFINAYSGAGGNGIIILLLNGATYVALTSGTSYTTPTNTISIKAWIIGGGGSGAGGGPNDGTSGGGAGAGGVSVKTWS